jgi:hypothetical protein
MRSSVASDQLSAFLEVLRSNPRLVAAMSGCLDVDDAVAFAHQLGFALARADLLTLDARMTFDELGIHGALKRHRSTSYRQRHE